MNLDILSRYLLTSDLRNAKLALPMLELLETTFLDRKYKELSLLNSIETRDEIITKTISSPLRSIILDFGEVDISNFCINIEVRVHPHFLKKIIRKFNIQDGDISFLEDQSLVDGYFISYTILNKEKKKENSCILV